jgi:hypothetical protein
LVLENKLANINLEKETIMGTSSSLNKAERKKHK